MCAGCARSDRRNELADEDQSLDLLDVLLGDADELRTCDGECSS